jgi:hypothetical protein
VIKHVFDSNLKETLMTKIALAAILSFASAASAGVSCPTGSFQIVSCESARVSAALCGTSMDGSAIVTSSGLFARIRESSQTNALKSVSGPSRASGTIGMNYFESGSQPGEIVLAGEKIAARCTHTPFFMK